MTKLDLPSRLAAWRQLGLVVVCLAVPFGLWSSCGDGNEFNVFQPIAEPLNEDEPKAKVEEARILLDQQDYDEALSLLGPMVGQSGEDSNDVRLLYAAAKLGSVNLDVWSIINDFLENQQKSSKSSGSSGQSGGGLDTLFESLGDTVLGTGEERTAKMTALVEAIQTLRTAPKATDKAIVNTACLFSGILAVPTISSAKTSITATETALTSIRDSATNGGATCPNIGLLESATASIAAAASQFSVVLQVAADCPFLDLDGTATQLNAIEQQLDRVKKNADKGCDALPTCPAALPSCQSLFPTCVQQTLGVGTSAAKAGDGELASCEIILHCSVGGACFQ